MNECQRLLNMLIADERVDGSKITLSRRIGRITCWSLNFHIDNTKNRFHEMSAVASQCLRDVSHAITFGDIVDVDLFEATANRIADDWQHSHPHLISSGASG